MLNKTLLTELLSSIQKKYSDTVLFNDLFLSFKDYLEADEEEVSEAYQRFRHQVGMFENLCDLDPNNFKLECEQEEKEKRALALFMNHMEIENAQISNENRYRLNQNAKDMLR